MHFHWERSGGLGDRKSANLFSDFVRDFNLVDLPLSG